MGSFYISNKKMYVATFNVYTNAQRNAICNKDDDMISLSEEPSYGSDGCLIISEDELEKYRHFGGGFKTLQYIGNAVPEDEWKEGEDDD